MTTSQVAAFGGILTNIGLAGAGAFIPGITIPGAILGRADAISSAMGEGTGPNSSNIVDGIGIGNGSGKNSCPLK